MYGVLCYLLHRGNERERGGRKWSGVAALWMDAKKKNPTPLPDAAHVRDLPALPL
jgi:hypothetical protein